MTTQGVDQHPARLGGGDLGKIGQLSDDRKHPRLGLVVAQLEVRRDRPGAAARGAAPVAHRGPGRPTRAVRISATSVTISLMARTSRPESVG